MRSMEPHPEDQEIAIEVFRWLLVSLEALSITLEALIGNLVTSKMHLVTSGLLQKRPEHDKGNITSG